MADDIVAISLSSSQAAFLQANLRQLATITRQAMARPGLEPERHKALHSRAIVLEITDDAVRSAMLEVGTCKSRRGVEAGASPRSGGRGAQPADDRVELRVEPYVRPRIVPSVIAAIPAPSNAPPHSARPAGGGGNGRIHRCRSNAWLSAFVSQGGVPG
jgi:hypothetical protein